MEYEYIGVKQATKEGIIKCAVPGCADLSYPTSKLRRGRVQGGGHVSPTLTTSGGGMQDNQMEKETIIIGLIDSDGYELANRVYANTSPTIRTYGGGWITTKSN